MHSLSVAVLYLGHRLLWVFSAALFSLILPVLNNFVSSASCSYALHLFFQRACEYLEYNWSRILHIHRAQVLFHYSFKRSEWRTLKKKIPHFYITIWLWLIWFHYSKCARWGFPLQRWCWFFHSILYTFKCLLIMFSTEYLIIMFFLIPDNHPVQKLNLEKSGFNSRQDHHLVFFGIHLDTDVSLYAKCSHHVILLLFFLYFLRIIK